MLVALPVKTLPDHVVKATALLSFLFKPITSALTAVTIQPVIHISKVAVVTRTDRPRSVRNRCVIELLFLFLCFTLPV